MDLHRGPVAFLDQRAGADTSRCPLGRGAPALRNRRRQLPGGARPTAPAGRSEQVRTVAADGALTPPPTTGQGCGALHALPCGPTGGLATGRATPSAPRGLPPLASDAPHAAPGPRGSTPPHALLSGHGRPTHPRSPSGSSAHRWSRPARPPAGARAVRSAASPELARPDLLRRHRRRSPPSTAAARQGRRYEPAGARAEPVVPRRCRRPQPAAAALGPATAQGVLASPGSDSDGARPPSMGAGRA